MDRPFLLGAVAYAPKVVTIWEGFRQWFGENDFPVDYVLYSNYERQVESLLKGHVDIAWNTPLAHVRVQKRTEGKSLSLGMRDSDRDFKGRVIVRKDAGIEPRARSAVPVPMREVSFAACQAREVAWENDGQGEFTRRAAALLADAERGGITNEEFHRRVVEAFGANRAQTPDLNCSDALRGARLLVP